MIFGEEMLDNQVASIVTDSQKQESSNSLLVLDRESLLKKKTSNLLLKNRSGLVLVVNQKEIKQFGLVGKTSKNDAFSNDFGELLKNCKTSKIPLVVLASSGGFDSTVTDLRQNLVHLLQEITLQIHQRIFNTVLEEGLDGLVLLLSEELRRPVSVETIDFKLVSQESMKSTPVKERNQLLKKAYQIIESLPDKKLEEETFIEIGKKVVIPLIHANKNLVGFLSVLVRPSDKLSDLMWILKPASLACMVHLVQRERGRVLSSANKSMLKELLLGSDLSAVELEKIEIHFGFDLYDGFYIFGIDTKDDDDVATKKVNWPDDKYVSVEVEGTRIFIVPYNSSRTYTWKEFADSLIANIKSLNKGVKIQLGAARPIETTLEFHEAYRQARQSLIIGSMMHSETEYAIGYGDLGLMRLLYLIVDHPELEQFYKEWLGPVEDYDSEWDTDLTETLRVYVDEGANLNSAARALFIHRHTLRYRLEQIEDDVLNIENIDSQEILLNLQVAFLIKKLLGYQSEHDKKG